MSLYASCPCGIPEGSDEPHLRTDCALYGIGDLTCRDCHGVGVAQKHHDSWLEGFRGTSVTFCHCVRGQRLAMERGYLPSRSRLGAIVDASLPDSPSERKR